LSAVSTAAIHFYFVPVIALFRIQVASTIPTPKNNTRAIGGGYAKKACLLVELIFWIECVETFAFGLDHA